MQLTKESEDLLAALGSDATAVVRTALAPTKGANAKLQELVQAWPNKAKEDLGQAILYQVKVCLAKFHDSADEETSSAEGDKEHVEEVLISLVGLVKRMIEEATGNISTCVQEAARHLHDQAILMADGAAELQEAVVRLCCLWWQKELPGKADMVPQMIPYLLYQATVSGRAADVKRCYSMRATLALLDFEDPSIQGVQALMVRGAMLPAFLRCTDGRKFIAHLFTLHPKMVYELTAVILNQIVSGRKSVLEAYGEIVFKAWRAATGACLERIETHLIQNSLIKSALRASSPALAASLRHVLEGLHSQRLTPGTDAMLLRLYHPLLFRDLAAANVGVRNNALQLLVDAFPLQDSTASAEESDELLQRQFEELSKGLQDEAPAVRMTAASGICSLLNMYWELVPAGTTAAYLKRLTEDVACDSSSPGVRLAVVQGLGGLVDNPLAQPLLKMVLPKLGPLLHDKALKVRTAVADLLLAVMRVRELHFVDIVDVEQLLQAMAHDLPQVAHRIQKLLLPSYFPDGSEGPARVAALLRQNPPAGKAFCASLCQAAPAQQVAALIAALRDHLLSSAPAAAAHAGANPSAAAEAAAAAAFKGSKRRRGRKQGSADAQPSEAGQQESPDGWQALLAGLAELCIGLATAVASDPDKAALLQGLFHPDALLQLLDLCRTALSRELVMHIAQVVPTAEASITVQARCVGQLLAVSEHNTMSDGELTSLMQCALAGPLRTSLVDALIGGLQAGQDPASPKACLPTALRCLDLGLQDPKMRDALLSEDLLRTALPLLRPDADSSPMHALMRAIEALPDCLEGVDGQEGLQDALQGRALEVGLAPAALVLYNRVALHLQLLAVNQPHHEQQGMADTTALSSMARAVDSVRSRQSSAERDVYAEQQQAAMAAASCGAGLAAAAEGAVVTSCEVAQKLLQQLEELGTSGVMEVTTQASSEVIQPQRKKGRKGSRQAPSAAPALRPCDCIQAAFNAAQGVLAVGGDAARLLCWGPSTPAATATLSLAVAMLKWSKDLQETMPDFRNTCCVTAISMVAFIGGNPQHALGLMRAPAPGPEQPHRHADSDSQAATQLYQAADTAASLQGCCSSVDDDRCTGVEAVAEAVMQRGCWDEEGRALQLMKPFLPAALLVLTRPQGTSRWLQPLAHLIGTALEAQLSREGELQTGRPHQSSEATAVSHGRQHGHDRLEGSPSLRGCEERVRKGDSQAPMQLNDQPHADDTDSHQVDKENVSVNQAAATQDGSDPGKGHQLGVIAESFHLDNSLLTAILAAAESSQVNGSLAEVAARTAAQGWRCRDLVSSLGAVQLVQMLGFPAQSSRSCRHSQQHAVFDGVAAQLRPVLDDVEHFANSSGDVVLPALQRQLQALLVQ